MDTTALLALLIGLLLGAIAGAVAVVRLRPNAPAVDASVTEEALRASLEAMARTEQLAADMRARIDTQTQVQTSALSALTQKASTDAVITEQLDRLHERMRSIEHSGSTWQGQFNAQVAHMRDTAESLRKETSTLSTALRKPQVRGQWGEMQLRRTVELAGMTEHCDFAEQATLDGGGMRPDLIIHLAGGRSVIVDSKVSLEAFLDATGADDEVERSQHLQRHAKHLRTHIDQLSSKRYWQSSLDTPEFTVMFLSSEASLMAALDADRDLVEHAAAHKIILATPTTLIALLRTVAYGWVQASLADQAKEIHVLGVQLFERLSKFNQHLGGVGRSLEKAVDSYNAAVGTLESRVLVSARRFNDLHVTEETLPTPSHAHVGVRALSSVDDDLALPDPTPLRAQGS